MEPHVAEIILEQMVEAESLVRVLKRTPLVGALLEEQRLLGARFRDGDSPLEVRAQVAIDATYEGDLAAAAGVAYCVGREGRSDHNESLAGNLFFDWRFNRQEILPRSTGESSGYVQAYCFRETLRMTRPGAFPRTSPRAMPTFCRCTGRSTRIWRLDGFVSCGTLSGSILSRTGSGAPMATSRP